MWTSSCLLFPWHPPHLYWPFSNPTEVCRTLPGPCHSQPGSLLQTSVAEAHPVLLFLCETHTKSYVLQCLQDLVPHSDSASLQRKVDMTVNMTVMDGAAVVNILKYVVPEMSLIVMAASLCTLVLYLCDTRSCRHYSRTTDFV